MKKFTNLKEIFNDKGIVKDVSESIKDIIGTRYEQYKNGENWYTSDVERMDYKAYPTRISYIFQNILGEITANLIAILDGDDVADAEITEKLSRVVSDYTDDDNENGERYYPVDELFTNWDLFSEAVEIYLWDLLPEEMVLGDFKVTPVNLKTISWLKSSQIQYKDDVLTISLENREYDIAMRFKLKLNGEEIISFFYNTPQREDEYGEKIDGDI